MFTDPTSPRHAVRAVLIDPSEHVLLIQVADPSGVWRGWLTPGGGVQADETDEIALRRELREELGLSGFDMGPAVWHRRHAFTWHARDYDQIERFYWLFVPRFEPVATGMPEAEERASVVSCRWWALDEIKRSREVFAPRRLHELVVDILSAGLPPSAIEIGK